MRRRERQGVLYRNLCAGGHDCGRGATRRGAPSRKGSRLGRAPGYVGGLAAHGTVTTTSAVAYAAARTDEEGSPRRGATGRGPFRALRHRNYRLFFVGQSVSLVGSWVQMTALMWLA